MVSNHTNQTILIQITTPTDLIRIQIFANTYETLFLTTIYHNTDLKQLH